MRFLRNGYKTRARGRIAVQGQASRQGPTTAGRADGVYRNRPALFLFDLLNRSDYAGVAYRDASGPRKG